MRLSEKQARLFTMAVEGNYYFESVLDNLPIRAFVGEMATGDGRLRPCLYTHRRFDISFNADRVSPGSACCGPAHS